MKKFTAIILAMVMLFSVIPFSASAADEDVARMWFCAEKSKKSGIGHVFLYFENLTDETIVVGRYELAAYDTVSVGSFGTEGPRGGGVYYNLESDLTHYHSLIATSTVLSEDELNDVTNKIKNYNYWDAIRNCYYFACMGWNAGADKTISFLLFPAFARLIINSRGGGSAPFDIFVEKPVFKQNEL